MDIKKFGKAMLGALAMTASLNAQADILYAASSSKLAVIDTLNLATVNYINITGLATSERLLGFDIRPSNGLGYAVTNTNKLYTIDLSSGVSTLVASLTGTGFTGLNNQSVGLDFNPQADFAGGSSLRLVTGAGKNYAVNANTGAVGNGSASIAGGFTGVAYTNSSPGDDPRNPANLTADVTDLYYINSSDDTLKMAPAAFNAPVISTVGTLGVDAITANGFDILGNGQAYALLDVNGSFDSNLYSINLQTGAATYLATLDGAYNGLTGVATVPEPENMALLLAGMGLMGMVLRRRS